MILGLFTGQARSVLDSARTWPVSIGWRTEGPETNYQRQLVESISSLGGARVGLVNGKARWELQNHHRKVQNFTKIGKYFVGICKFSLKSVVIWPDQAKSH